MDWMKNINDQDERERIANQQAEEERREAEVADRIRQSDVRHAAAVRLFEEKTRKLGDSFGCHICQKRASIPTTRTDSYEDYDEMKDRPTTRTYTFEDWSQPGDLFQCKRCKEWTCEEHLHNGTCQKCGEDPGWQNRLPKKVHVRSPIPVVLATLLAFSCLCLMAFLVYWQIILPLLSGPK
jgi:hypothetical protein